MGDYLVIIRRDQADPARLTALQIAARLAGMTVSSDDGFLWIATAGPFPPKISNLGCWTLIGDVFDRQPNAHPLETTQDSFDYERKLLRRIWGRFIGIRSDGMDRPDAVLRDPSGALECVAWEQNGLTILTSATPDWLIDTVRADWRIDFTRVETALRDPLLVSGDLLLDGPATIAPGSLQPLPLGRPAISLWQPSDFAELSLDAPPSPEDAADRMREAVDEAVRGLSGVAGPVACEISGGLDSSIVATSLSAVSGPNVRCWLNAYGETSEADERLYVEALARTLDIRPTVVPHATGPLTEPLLERISTGPRPGLNALDVHHDLDWARHLSAAGANAVLTGKGGDSILLQSATPDVFTDAWLARRWPALFDPHTRHLARTTERSVWSLLGSARRHRPAGLATADQPRTRHLWLADLSRFGPAKAFHISGVLDSVSRHAPSALTETVDVRHPLCAQPVIEACLALPTPLLTLGGRDRGLARQAFRDRLPSLVAARRSKGDMTRIYARMIHDSLDVLRPLLLDGRLAEHGIIDRTAMDGALTKAELLWQGQYAQIMAAAAFEAWIRVWERRLSRIR